MTLLAERFGVGDCLEKAPLCYLKTKQLKPRELPKTMYRAQRTKPTRIVAVVNEENDPRVRTTGSVL